VYGVGVAKQTRWGYGFGSEMSVGLLHRSDDVLNMRD